MTDPCVELKVWKRRDAKTAVLYRCFQDLGTGQFTVQSCDFFRLPVDDEQLRDSDGRFVELLIEAAPGDRSGWFGSVDEAIAAHDRHFS